MLITFQLMLQVIVDEISMVKSDMLYQLDFRLQEIMMNQKPFGGISLFVFGDLMQLKPVMGNFIFEKPYQKDYEMLHRCNPRWKMFRCIVLEKNHRQGKDKGYAELLNRLRIGAETEEDIETLKSRIRNEKHNDIQKADLFIGAKRKDCFKINQNHIFKKIKGELIKIHSINYQQNQKEFKPRVNEKDETIGNTKFQNKLLLKRSAKVMIIHNIDTIDGLTNGQFGILIDVTYKNDQETVDKLIIVVLTTLFDFFSLQMLKSPNIRAQDSSLINFRIDSTNEPTLPLLDLYTERMHTECCLYLVTCIPIFLISSTNAMFPLENAAIPLPLETF